MLGQLQDLLRFAGYLMLVAVVIVALRVATAAPPEPELSQAAEIDEHVSVCRFCRKNGVDWVLQPEADHRYRKRYGDFRPYGAVLDVP